MTLAGVLQDWICFPVKTSAVINTVTHTMKVNTAHFCNVSQSMSVLIINRYSKNLIEKELAGQCKVM